MEKLFFRSLLFIFLSLGIIRCGHDNDPKPKPVPANEIEIPSPQPENEAIPPETSIEDEMGNEIPIVEDESPEQGEEPQLDNEPIINPKAPYPQKRPGVSKAPVAPDHEDLPDVVQTDQNTRPIVDDNPRMVNPPFHIERPPVVLNPPSVPKTYQPPRLNRPPVLEFPYQFDKESSRPQLEDHIASPLPPKSLEGMTLNYPSESAPAPRQRPAPLLPTLSGSEDEPPIAQENPDEPSFMAFNTGEVFKTIAKLSWHSLGKDDFSFYTFNCKDCPKSFGTLLISSIPENDVRNISACQGVLIAEDVFMTNRHCVPEDLKREGVLCDDRMRVVFHRLNENTPAQVGHCKEIISIGNLPDGVDEDEHHQDWALLRLKESIVGRATPPRLKGVSEDDKLYNFIPLKREDGSIDLRMIRCHGVQRRWNAPHFMSDMSAITAYYCDHPTRNGFSGSPTYVYKNGSWRPVSLRSWSIKNHPVAFEVNDKDYYDAKDVNLGCVTPLNNKAMTMDDCEITPGTNRNKRAQILNDTMDDLIQEVQDQFMNHTTENEKII